ncbi:MAG: YmdB family metallophosphoesterase [Candidatus Izimaplasma sp.]|nr:YmdB family metallophosphoesterase [Candidatus Izimaplasma bacterium]
MRVLFIGDVFGDLGKKALKAYLPELKREHKPHIIIVNGENISGGFGITEEDYKDLMLQNVSCVTLGNHSFSKRELKEFIDESNIIRPANYHQRVPGKGYLTINFNGKTLTIINLMGRIFMGDPIDNPFIKIDEILANLTSDYIIVDMHAEATSEKIALAHYLDGRVDAFIGTHTHVPTADSMVFPNGLLYQTDVGMTGAKYGVLGAEEEPIIDKFIDGMHRRIKQKTSGKLQLNATLLDLTTKTIKPIQKYE